MRRRLHQLLLLVGMFCVSMFLLAGPVMATESTEADHSEEMSEEVGEEADHESEDAEEAKEEAKETEDKFMGTTSALLGGLLLGAICFAMSNPGGIERVSDDAHH